MTSTKLPGRPPQWASALFAEVQALRTDLAEGRVYPKLVAEQAPVVATASPDGERTPRGLVVAALDDAVTTGMPAFDSLNLGGDIVSFDLGSEAELQSWLVWFGAQDTHVSHQPYPGLSDPAAATTWLSSAVVQWRGWSILLGARDPITDEQRQQWIDSGRAARHAKLEAKQEAALETKAAADPTGLTYSRVDSEPDDPTPVSPARGGQPHVVAVTDGGLVDETPPVLAKCVHGFVTDGGIMTCPNGCPKQPIGGLAAVTGAVVRDSSVVLVDEAPEIVHAGDDYLLPRCGAKGKGSLPTAFSASLITCPACMDIAEKDGGELVDETPAESLMPAPIASHYDAAAEVGEFVCACGEEFVGIDSLKRHIKAGNAAPVSGAR